MNFSWIILLLVTMVHTRATVKKEQDDPNRDKTKEANEDSSEFDEEEWEDFFKEVQQKIDEEDRQYLKNKKLKKSASTTRQYTRRKSVKRSGIQITEPLTRARSLSGIQQSKSPWIEGQDALSASTQNPSTSERMTAETDALASIRQEQQRLSAEQERLSRELQHISSEHKKIKKKYSNISKMLKGFLSKLSCTSSDTSD